jgi:adenine deaminase
LAKSQEKVDLVVKNANVVNVFSGDVHETDVAIADGIFVGFGEGYLAKNTYDPQGKFMCPGLIDGHIDLESTFLSPIEFCNVVALHGTIRMIYRNIYEIQRNVLDSFILKPHELHSIQSQCMTRITVHHEQGKITIS